MEDKSRFGNRLAIPPTCRDLAAEWRLSAQACDGSRFDVGFAIRGSVAWTLEMMNASVSADVSRPSRAEPFAKRRDGNYFEQHPWGFGSDSEHKSEMPGATPWSAICGQTWRFAGWGDLSICITWTTRAKSGGVKGKAMPELSEHAQASRKWLGG